GSYGWSTAAPASRLASRFDRRRQSVHQPEAPLRALHHQVADVAAANAAGGRHPGDRLAVAAVDRERDAHPLAVVAADLEAVRHQRASGRSPLVGFEYEHPILVIIVILAGWSEFLGPGVRERRRINGDIVSSSRIIPMGSRGTSKLGHVYGYSADS